MKTPVTLAVSTLGLTALFAPAALAQQDDIVCAKRDAIVERLGADFGEQPTGGGVMSREQLLEIWSAPDTGTWTALMTFADGTSCIVGSGENWHQGLPDAVPAGTRM
ncbi:hypothetical protein [Psychromarinibacter sp. S121]|uniref:hypothetical protein n=1 Tax=Psychromarinibacter sp. S121 TaxID=3415127 RepID=UPI003C7E7C53